MTKEEMVETSTELKKDRNEFFAKAVGWAVLCGLAVKGFVTNYALSSNSTMMSALLDEMVKKNKEE